MTGEAAGAVAPGLLDSLCAIVGERYVLTSEADLAPHLIEGRGLYRGDAVAVVRPASTEEVSRVVEQCRRAGTAIVPQGGNTGLVGGGVPHGAVVLGMHRLNRIIDVDALNSTMTVQSGCILANVQEAAAEADRYFPLSLSSEGSCQIGGVLATNAGGTNVLRYGNARDLALGLEVVLPDGRVLNDLVGLRKNNTGYDLRNLFIGSEGTLGVITAAVLKLFPRPRGRVTAFVGCASARDTLALFDRLRARAADRLTTFEYLPDFALQMVLEHVAGAVSPMAERHRSYALIELTSADPESDLAGQLEELLAVALEDGVIADAVRGTSETQNQALWHLRESVSEVQKQEGASIKHDVAVPVSRVADFIEAASAACLKRLPDIRLCPFGHVGDGNIHFNISQPKGMAAADFLSLCSDFNRIVHDIVARMGGSISAEHGIGLMKREELTLYKDPVALQLMQALKSAIDPGSLMNPGKVLP